MWSLVHGMRAFLSTPLTELAGRQHGVVSGAQLYGLGFSRGKVARMVSAGHLIRLFRGVFAVGHARLTAYGRWMAAVLSCGDNAVLSHTTAAALWDLRRTNSAAIHITIPLPAKRESAEQLTVHRSAIPYEITKRNGIPTTTASRTIQDCAALLSLHDLTRLVEQAEKLHLLDVNQLQPTPGRKGGANLSKVLTAYAEPALTRSKLERDMLALCRHHGLPTPHLNVVVDAYTVDFLWPHARLIAETDGRRDHATTEAFQRDRTRDQRLLTLGYRVVRFTYADVTERPAYVAATLASLLRS